MAWYYALGGGGGLVTVIGLTYRFILAHKALGNGAADEHTVAIIKALFEQRSWWPFGKGGGPPAISG